MAVKLRKYKHFFIFPIARQGTLCHRHSRQGAELNTQRSTCRRFNTHPKDHHHGDEEEEEDEEGREEVLIGLMPVSPETGIAFKE
jgi:hypothetical protein